MLQETDLIQIAGQKNVSLEPRILDQYANNFGAVNAIKPACVVKPGNSEDIIKIIKLANSTLTPLIPVSSGPPHFRGDTTPRVEGAVILDLSNMKKVIRVDRINRVVMFEPGVTFGELIPAVGKEGLRLNMPLLPRRSKSVVASLLEREPVIMPGYQWDVSDPLACVEIIWGTGDKFRTGSASGPGSLEEQWAAGGAQDESLGPGPTSWHRSIQGSQGTMGVVTWASARCELLPRREEPFLCGAENLDKILDLVHWLIRLRLVNECCMLNNTNLATIMSRERQDDYRRLKTSLPAWIVFYNLAGYDYFPEERINYRVQDVQEVGQRVGLKPVKSLGEITAEEILRKTRSPSEEPYWKLRYAGASQDIFFLTIYEKLEEMLQVMKRAARTAGYTADMGIYLQPVVQGTSCYCEINLFYNPRDPQESEKVRKLAIKATDNLLEKGAFFSRPYGENTARILNRNPAAAAAAKKIKKIFDPNNIMNPGQLSP
jgi:hypothetical protein